VFHHLITKSGGRSVGIVCLQTTNHGIQFFFSLGRASTHAMPLGIMHKINYLSIPEPGELCQYSDMLWAEQPGFDSWQELEIFLYSTVSRLALGPTQPPIQWVLGALSLGVKRPGHEAESSPPSSAEVRNGGAIPPFHHMSSWHNA
jgi:hypothetical protein